MDSASKFFFHKLTLRISYIFAAYASTHLVDLISSERIQDILEHIFVNPELKPGAIDFMKASLGMGIMVVGEFVYHWTHTKYILPKVNQPKGEQI